MQPQVLEFDLQLSLLHSSITHTMPEWDSVDIHGPPCVRVLVRTAFGHPRKAIMESSKGGRGNLNPEDLCS